MDVSYIAAAPALARLHQAHRTRADRTAHHLDAARSHRDRSHIRRLLRGMRTRRTFDDVAAVVPAPPETRHIGALG
jgi:hypothetical protein